MAETFHHFLNQHFFTYSVKVGNRDSFIPSVPSVPNCSKLFIHFVFFLHSLKMATTTSFTIKASENAIDALGKFQYNIAVWKGARVAGDDQFNTIFAGIGHQTIAQEETVSWTEEFSVFYSSVEAQPKAKISDDGNDAATLGKLYSVNNHGQWSSSSLETDEDFGVQNQRGNPATVGFAVATPSSPTPVPFYSRYVPNNSKTVGHPLEVIAIGIGSSIFVPGVFIGYSEANAYDQQTIAAGSSNASWSIDYSDENGFALQFSSYKAKL